MYRYTVSRTCTLFLITHGRGSIMADTTLAAAPAPAKPRVLWTIWHSVSILALLITTGLAGWFIPARLTAWLVSMALLIAFIAIAGHGVTGNWRGALIDEQNRISLS